MVGFRTKSGTIYYINQQERLFYGGKYKNPVPYVSLHALIGMRAQVILADGRVITTSEVVAYI